MPGMSAKRLLKELPALPMMLAQNYMVGAKKLWRVP